MSIVLRRAVDADLPGLADIDGREQTLALGPGACRELLHSMAHDRALLLVADRGGQLAGFAACSRVLDEATLLALAVDPGHRRRGVGGALLGKTLGALAGAGLRRCLLEVRASNTAAIALYRHQGFLEDGRRRGYYPARGTLGSEDAVLMSRSLEP